MRFIPFFLLLVCTFFFLSLHAEVSSSPSPIPIAADGVIVDSQGIEEPPQWIVDGLDMLYKVPVVGPVVAKAVQWAAVVGTLLTLLAGFLMASIKALSGVLAYAKFSEWALKIQAFQDSKVFYWIKYFSFLNAKKDEKSGSVKTNS